MMTGPRSYRVSEVAQLARVSIRTLHHYDEIGLLVPAARTDAGYRLYAEEDLLRLQQILIGRELGLALEDIRRSLDDPAFDRRQALLRQRCALENQAERALAMLRAVDAALALIDGKQPTQTAGTMNLEEIFDGFEPSLYEPEVEARWGDTDAFKEARQRTQRYTERDWQELRAEQAAIYTAASEALQAGKSPRDAEVRDLAERHRRSIERWFYPCSLEMHRGLATLYEQDARFAQNIDKYGSGLTAFLVAAIRENAGRPGA